MIYKFAIRGIEICDNIKVDFANDPEGRVISYRSPFQDHPTGNRTYAGIPICVYMGGNEIIDRNCVIITKYDCFTA